MLIAPGVHVSTAEVYANTVPGPAEVNLLGTLTHDDPAFWHSTVKNRMESYVLTAYPEVALAKQRLLNAGATYASMSGSGSSVFALFEQKPEPLSLPEGQRAWTMRF